MPKPTTSDIIAAHGAHVVGQKTPQPLDVWAAEAMGLGKFDSHKFDNYHNEPCEYCKEYSHDAEDLHCTRYTTDLTSVREFELAHLPSKWERTIGLADDVYEDARDTVGIHLDRDPDQYAIQVFTGKPLPVNWSAAILWAAAHDREQREA